MSFSWVPESKLHSLGLLRKCLYPLVRDNQEPPCRYPAHAQRNVSCLCQRRLIGDAVSNSSGSYVPHLYSRQPPIFEVSHYPKKGCPPPVLSKIPELTHCLGWWDRLVWSLAPLVAVDRTSWLPAVSRVPSLELRENVLTQIRNKCEAQENKRKDRDVIVAVFSSLACWK